MEGLQLAGGKVILGSQWLGSWCVFSQCDETPLSHCLSGPSGVNWTAEFMIEQPYKRLRAYHLVGVVNTHRHKLRYMYMMHKVATALLSHLVS